jgi:hypothetical protein
MMECSRCGRMECGIGGCSFKIDHAEMLALLREHYNSRPGRGRMPTMAEALEWDNRVCALIASIDGK